MAENRIVKGEGFYYFSRGQLAILAVGFTLVSAAIFFLGTLIGQGIEERKLLTIKGEQPVAKTSLRPLPQGSAFVTGVPAEQEMTLYQTLTQSPARVEVKATGKGKPARPKGKAAKAQAKETNRSVKGKRAASLMQTTEKASPTTRKQRRLWSIQVNAFPHERDARSLAKRLKDKGYHAYVVSTNIKGRIWYRVRVGKVATRAAAKDLQQALKEKERFSKTFISRR